MHFNLIRIIRREIEQPFFAEVLDIPADGFAKSIGNLVSPTMAVVFA